MADKKIHITKIPGVPEDLSSLSFGQQIEHFRSIQEWKKTALSAWASQKRQPFKKAIRDFVRLTKAKEYYTTFFPKWSGCEMWDDTFEIFYKI